MTSEEEYYPKWGRKDCVRQVISLKINDLISRWPRIAYVHIFMFAAAYVAYVIFTE